MAIQAPVLPQAGLVRTDERLSRGALLRRLVIFQIKLFADGARDFVLSPISLVVAAFGIVFGGNHPHRLFDRLMHAGHLTDDWIDLFGRRRTDEDGPGLDRMIDAVETALRNDHARGGLTAEAERRLRTLAEELRRRASRRQGF